MKIMSESRDVRYCTRSIFKSGVRAPLREYCGWWSQWNLVVLPTKLWQGYLYIKGHWFITQSLNHSTFTQSLDLCTALLLNCTNYNSLLWFLPLLPSDSHQPLHSPISLLCLPSSLLPSLLIVYLQQKKGYGLSRSQGQHSGIAKPWQTYCVLSRDSTSINLMPFKSAPAMYYSLTNNIFCSPTFPFFDTYLRASDPRLAPTQD